MDRYIVEKGLLSGSVVNKKSTCNAGEEMRFRFLGQEDPLEEGMATHSSILAWRIHGQKESGGLESTGSQGWTRLSTHTCTQLKTVTSSSCKVLDGRMP